VQDRSEQNAGYDAIGRADEAPAGEAAEGEGRPEGELDAVVKPEGAGEARERIPPASARPERQHIDLRAEREAAADVRRRERER
jgi:hypothetical protein